MKVKNTKKKYAVIAIALLILLLVVYVSRIYFPIEGTVIDTETKQPIEGAVILAEWTITPTAWIGLPTTYSYKVIETVTDKSGRFVIGSYILNPLVNKTDFSIYKAGHVCWNNKYIFPGNKHREGFEWKRHGIYEIERFKREYSYNDHVNFIDGRISSFSSIGKERFEQAYRWEVLKRQMELSGEK